MLRLSLPTLMLFVAACHRGETGIDAPLAPRPVMWTDGVWVPTLPNTVVNSWAAGTAKDIQLIDGDRRRPALL
jgi:hypothetical protein